MKKLLIFLMTMMILASVGVFGYNETFFINYNLDTIPQNLAWVDYNFNNGIHTLKNTYTTIGLKYLNFTIPDYDTTTKTYYYQVPDYEFSECKIIYDEASCVDMYLKLNTIKTSLAQKQDIREWKKRQIKLNTTTTGGSMLDANSQNILTNNKNNVGTSVTKLVG